MPTYLRIAVLVIALVIGVYAQDSPSPVRVLIATEIGDIEAEVYTTQAPTTSANFLRYVDSGYYNGGTFYRTVRGDNQPNNAIRIAVIQAGLHPWQENFSFPPIPLERTSLTGILHTNGTLSMARGEPNSATSSFFICVGDQPELDFGGKRNPDGQGFAAFGRVIKGIEVVRRIHATKSEGQAIMPPVRILRVERIR